jgi:hypothetical protein
MKGKIILKKVSNRCKSCQVETSLLGAFTSLKIVIFYLIFFRSV